MAGSGGVNFWLTVSGFLIGGAFGALVARTNYCAMGGVTDLVLLGDGRRLRAWLLAALTAILGTQALAAADLLDFTASIYLSDTLNWMGHSVGGLIFGVGMVLAGGCVSRNLVRTGSGDVRALVVLAVIAVTALSAQSGWLADLRRTIAEAQAVPLAPADSGAVSLISAAFDMPPELTRLFVVLPIAAVLTLLVLRDPAFRASPNHIASGVGVGLLVVAGWAVTSHFRDELSLVPARLTSLTFVGPLAGVLTWSSGGASIAWPGFAVASVAGTMLGAFAVSLSAGRFRFEGFADMADALRGVAGGAMMGLGGVMALGCTIGQGVSGLATLSTGALLTFLSMLAGARLGIAVLSWSIDSDG